MADELITKQSVVNLIYPVGSIYMSVNATSPGTLFGGTWVQLQDRFLLGAGSTYTAGGMDGAATVTLTAAQSGLRNHTHSFTNPSVTVSSHNHTISHTHNMSTNGTSRFFMTTTSSQIGDDASAALSGSGYKFPRINNEYSFNAIGNTASISTTASGNATPTASASGGAVGGTTEQGGSAHNNMPPYLVVYMWKRTA